jgi:tRNA 2-thiouridine synthesizing protein B
MLHLIFQTPNEIALFERIDSGDIAVFLENSVLRLLQNSSLADLLKQQLSNKRFCVLKDDLLIRGIAPDELVKGIEIINYLDFVELTIKNPLIQSWIH